VQPVTLTSQSPFEQLQKECEDRGVSFWNPIEDPLCDKSLIPTTAKLIDIPYQYGRHLDNALETSRITFYREHPKYVQRSYPGLNADHFQEIVNGKIKDVVLLSWLQNQITTSFMNEEWADDRARKRVLQTTEDALNIQVQLIPGWNGTTESTNVSDRIKRLRDSMTHFRSFRWKRIALNVHRLLHLGGQVHKGYFTTSRLQDWYFYRELVVITSFPRGPIVIPFSLILSVLDKIEGLYSLETFLEVSMGSFDKINTEFATLTRFIYNELSGAYSKEGNSAVDLFKGLETLALGAVLRANPKTISDTLFLARSINDLLDKIPQLRSEIINISVKFVQYIDDHGDVGIHHVLEQYGQEKLHFFPMVESCDGLAKMYRIGTGLRKVDSKEVLNLVGLFKLMYIHQYHLKEGILPPILAPSNLDPNLRRIFKTGDLPSLSQCLKIDLKIWGRLHFKAHQVFDYCENELQLLDDKGISPRLSKMNQCFNKDALSELGLMASANPDTTRLVIDMLRKENVNVQEYFEQCEREGKIPYEWRLIRLKLKERELKLVARAFSILHPNTRHMASVSERNIADRILPYFSQQSMTKSGVELKETIDSFTAHLGENNETWVAMILDLFQWNYTFRPELQQPFAECFNEIFGVRNFTTLQYIFRDAVLISADPFSPPGLSDKFSGWIHHAGGNQGIFQKFWTLITLVAIKHVMIECNLEHVMTGAGDNQVIIFNTAGLADPAFVVATVKDKLSQMFRSIGLQLKPEETWYSDVLFNYQRRYFYKGTPCSIGMKQITRAFAEGSDGSLGLNNVISTAMNTGVAIAAAVCDPLTGPLMAYIEAYTHLLEDSRWSMFKSCDPRLLALLSVLNTEMGYLPFLQLQGFYYSGHADHPTDSIAMLRLIWKKNPAYRKFIAAALRYEGASYSGETALSLVLDPLGFPVRLGPSPEAFVRQEVEAYLKNDKQIANIRLRTVLGYLNPKARIDLAASLMTIRPIDLSFLHELMENHVIGQSYAVLNKFTKLGSLSRAAEYDKTHKNDTLGDLPTSGTFAHRIERLSCLLANRIIRQLKKLVVVDDDFFVSILGTRYDPTESSRSDNYHGFCAKHGLKVLCSLSLRLYLTSWTAGLLPERLYGPFVPSPWEQIEFSDSTNRLDEGKSLSVMLIQPPGSSQSRMHIERGPLKPYRGTATADSVKTTPLVNLKGLAERTNIRSLLRLNTWALSLGDCEELVSLIEKLIECRLPSCAKELIRMQPEKAGGSYRHRCRSSIEDKGSYINSQDCFSSYVRISSNYLFYFNEGHIDYNIFFQRIYNFIIMSKSIGDSAVRHSVATIRLECCTYEVDNPKFQVDPSQFPREVYEPKGYALTPASEQKIMQELAHRSSFNMVQLPHDYDSGKVVAAFLAHRLVKQIYYHEKGLAVKGKTQPLSERFTTQYNTSHFRETSIPNLSNAVAATLVLHNFQQCNRSCQNLERILGDWLSLPVVPIDVGPFTKFLAAMEESGRIPALVSYCGTFPGFLTRRSDKHLLRLLIMGVWKALREREFIGDNPIVLIEQRSSSSSLNYVVGCLTANSLAYRETWKISSHRHPRLLIEARPPPESWINPLLTPDAEMTLSIARRKTKDHTSLVESPVVTSELSIPSVHLLSGQTWDSTSQLTEDIINQSPDVPRWARFLHKVPKAGSKTPNAKYKLLEIIKNYNWDLGGTSVYVCLADGGGSYSSLLMHMNPEASLIFNTLLRPQDIAPEQIGHHLPITLFCDHIHPSSITDRSLTGVNFGDLSDPQTLQQISDVDLAQGRPVDLLTFDMEYIEDQSPQVLDNLMRFVRQNNIHRCVIKLFSSAPKELLSYVIGVLRSLFGEVSLHKPSFSNYLSTEFFVITYHRRRAPVPIGDSNLNHIIGALNTRRLNLNENIIAKHCLDQLHWRRGLVLCGSSDLIGITSTRTLTTKIIQEAHASLRALLSVTITKIEETIPMDLASQHMLMGDTEGGRLTWEGISLVLIILSHCILDLQLNVMDYIRERDATRQSSAISWILRVIKHVDEFCQTDHALTTACSILGITLMTGDLWDRSSAIRVSMLIASLLKEYHWAFPKVGVTLSNVLEKHIVLCGEGPRLMQINKCIQKSIPMLAMVKQINDRLDPSRHLHLWGVECSNDVLSEIINTALFPLHDRPEGSDPIYLDWEWIERRGLHYGTNKLYMITLLSRNVAPSDWRVKTIFSHTLMWKKAKMVGYLLELSPPLKDETYLDDFDIY